MTLKVIFIALGFCFIPNQAFSANVHIGNDRNNSPVIFISGAINKGDFKQVQMVTKKYIELIVKDEDRTDTLRYALNSEGGDVEEAIKIGRLFRKSLAEVYVWGNRLVHETEKEAKWVMEHRSKGWAEEYETQNTVIYSDKRPLTDKDIKKCHSACVLMLLGGTRLLLIDNHYWVDDAIGKNIPVIGLHRPHVSPKAYADLSPQEAEVLYQGLEEIVRKYLVEVGATQELMDRIFKSSSNEIDLINSNDFKKITHMEAPFYSEWIIAKCGVTDDGRNLLSEEEYAYKNRVFEEKSKEAAKYHDGWLKAFINYFPDGFSKQKYESIMSKVRAHNTKVWQCEENALKNHQANLFSG